MEVHDKLAELRAYVEAARSVPMSASVMVNRGELRTLLDELAALLPADLAEADKLLAERRDVLGVARAEADRLVAEARERQRELVAEHELVVAAGAEAERIVAAARAQAQEIRSDAEDYADERLANIELVLERLLTAVKGGRDHLSNLAEVHAAHAGIWASGEGGPAGRGDDDGSPGAPASAASAPGAPQSAASWAAGVGASSRRPEPVE
jgi:hypothetical protein